MNSEQPLVLKLISYLAQVSWTVINLISYVAWSPILLYFSLAQSILAPKNFSVSPVFYWILIPIRWFLVTITYPILITYSLLLPYLVYTYSKHDGFLASIISSGSILLGWIFLLVKGHKNTANSTDLNMAFLFNQAFSSQLEMLAFLLSVIASVGVLRISHFIKSLNQVDNLNKVKEVCIGMFVITIIDYLTLPFILGNILLLVRVTYALPATFKFFGELLKGEDAHNTNIYGYKTYHGYFVCEFFLSLWDLIVFILTIPFIFITIYRFKNFIIKFYNATPDNRAKLCGEEILEILIDLPFIILIILTLPFFWRYYFIWKNWNNKQPLRKCIYIEFLNGVLDIPLFISVIVIFITQYRWKDATAENKNQDYFQWKLHKIFLLNFIYIIRDVIVHAIFLPFVLLGFWRLSKFYEDYFKTDYHKKSHVLFDTFVEVLIDYFHIVLSILSFHRLFFIIYHVYQKKPQTREFVIEQFYKTLIDLPMVFCYIVLLLTYYRYNNIDNNNLHRTCFTQFIELLIDLPFIIIGILSFWRIYFIIKFNIKGDKKAEETRKEALRQFGLFLIDIPCLLCFLSLLITFYRFFGLIKKLFNENENTVHNIIFKEFIELLIDIPFIIMFILSLWRIPLIIIGGWNQNAEERRSKSFEQFTLTLTDIPFIISLLLMTLSIIFIFNIFELFKKRDFRREIIYFGMKIPFQLHIILLTYLSPAVFWRFPLLFLILKNSKDSRERVKGILNHFIIGIFDIITLVFIFLNFLSFINFIPVIEILTKDSFFINSVELKDCLSTHFKVILLFIQFIKQIPFAFSKKFLIFCIERSVDIPFIIAGIMIALSLYRTRNLFNNKPYRQNILQEFKELMMDLPLIIMSIISSLVSPWKFILLFKTLFFLKNNKERRDEMIKMIIWTFVDFLCMIMLLVILVIFWRIPFLVYDIFYEKIEIRKAIYKEFLYALHDIYIIIGLAFLIYTLNYIPKTITRLYRYFKYLFNVVKIPSCKSSKPKKDVPELNGRILFQNEIPTEIFHEVFTYLKGDEIAKNVEPVCKEWNQMTKEAPLWKQVYQISIRKKIQKQSNITQIFEKAFSSEYYKNLYIKDHPKRIKPKSKEEEEYQKGLRIILNEQIVHSFFNCWKFLLIPLKLLGIFVIPIFLYNSFRSESLLNRNIQLSHLNTDYTSNLHQFAIYTLITFFKIIFYDLYSAVSSFYLVLIYIIFLGFPLWKEIVYKNAILSKFFTFILVIIQLFISIPLVVSHGVFVLLPFYYPIRNILARDVFVYFSFIEIPMINTKDFSIYLYPYVLLFKLYIYLYYFIVYLIQKLFQYEFITKSTFYIIWIYYFLGYIPHLYRSFDVYFPEFKPFYYIHLIIYLTFKNITKLFKRIYYFFFELFSAITHSYGSILSLFTNISKRLGFIGELLLIPISLTWMFWPLFTIYYLRSIQQITIWYWIPGILFSVILLFRGRKIISDTYKKNN